MLKRPIKYKDFNGEETEEIFYFNIAKPEIIDLMLEDEGSTDMASFIRRIVEETNARELIKMFKRIVLLAYGQKSDDGKRFVKNDELREAFSQTAAYHALFMELATSDKAAADFLIGIMPDDMTDQLEAEVAKMNAVDTKPV